MKQLFALWGRYDSGKTRTLLNLIVKLKGIADEELYYEKLGSSDIADATAILFIGGVIIGITSRGDIGWELKKILDKFLEAGCIIIICPTRKNERMNGSVQTVKEFSASQGYKLNWIEKQRAETQDENLEANLNEIDAEKIFGEVRKALSAIPV